MRHLVLLLILTLLSAEVFAQYRPRPPRRYPVPVPLPLPRPTPDLGGYACFGTDLYRDTWFLHRFRFINECIDAIHDVRLRHRFCDDGAMYDRYGNFMGAYRDQCECRRWL